ncbi:MAG: ACP phosphodiesterase [Bacteroidales bacterium]|nr:ACP phosphodiesterase [Bacteroidales bacterium]
MNFLAHIFLSGDSALIKVGNFVGDWVKGSMISINAKYPPEMAKGIRMHRYIDNFTDTNDIVINSIYRFKPILGRYAGVAIDVIYDHFLAKNWNQYSNISLDNFVNTFYEYCIQYFDILPKNLQPLIPHLIISNRLKSYETIKGISAAFKTMECQTSFPKKTNDIIEILKINYTDIENEFGEFFEIIQKSIQKEFFNN